MLLPVYMLVSQCSLLGTGLCKQRVHLECVTSCLYAQGAESRAGEL